MLSLRKGPSGPKANVDEEDHKVLVSAADQVAKFLVEKLVAGANIQLQILNAGGDEQLEISATGGGSSPFRIVDSGTTNIPNGSTTLGPFTINANEVKTFFQQPELATSGSDIYLEGIPPTGQRLQWEYQSGVGANDFSIILTNYGGDLTLRWAIVATTIP